MMCAVLLCHCSCIDTVYDEKKEKDRNWEKKQGKLKDIEEARKKQESE